MAEAEWSWDDVRGEVKPRQDVVPLVLDGTVQRRLEVARKRLREARLDSTGTIDDGLADLRAEVEQLEEEAAASTREFTIVAIPHTQWRDLMLDHPSEEPGKRYDAATFVPAAIAACCPHFKSAKQVADAAADPEHGLTTRQITDLFTMVRKLNEGDDQVPFTLTG